MALSVSRLQNRVIDREVRIAVGKGKRLSHVEGVHKMLSLLYSRQIIDDDYYSSKTAKQQEIKRGYYVCVAANRIKYSCSHHDISSDSDGGAILSQRNGYGFTVGKSMSENKKYLLCSREVSTCS